MKLLCLLLQACCIKLLLVLAIGVPNKLEIKCFSTDFPEMVSK